MHHHYYITFHSENFKEMEFNRIPEQKHEPADHEVKKKTLL